MTNLGKDGGAFRRWGLPDAYDLLGYCELDTLAMVRIFKAL